MGAPVPLPAPTPDLPRKGRRTRLIVLFCLSALALLVILLNLGKGTYQSYRMASAAAEHFHHQLDAADYDAIYGEGSLEFRRSGKREDLERFLGLVHQKMGSTGKTSTAGFHVNWTNGRMWIDQVFDTQVTLGQGRESFIWVMERDHLRLYGYHIDSPNLR